jgi:DNA-binding Lrp family transcriptional regulator
MKPGFIFLNTDHNYSRHAIIDNKKERDKTMGDDMRTRTLDQLIGEAFGRKGKKGARDADILRNWFRNYFGGEGDGKILETPAAESLDDISDFLFGIESGLRSFPNDKQSQAKRLQALLRYLQKRYDCAIDLTFLDTFMIRSREERLLQILTYLHSGNKSRADIAEALGISERTLSNDLATLMDGFEFMGYQMKISQLKQDNSYTSLIHPLFLAMRTDEIFSLTVGLKLISKGTVFEESLSRLADMVYKQLSSPAKVIIDQHSESHDISYTDSEMKFIDSITALKTRAKANLPYFLKEPIPCRVLYISGDTEKSITGIMRLHNDGSNQWDKIRMENEDGEIIVEVHDVFLIERIE